LGKEKEVLKKRALRKEGYSPKTRKGKNSNFPEKRKNFELSKGKIKE